MTRRAELRAAMGRDALLTPAEAVERLPIRDEEAASWLRREGLVHQLLGREVVVWGDVLDAIRRGQGEPPPPPTHQPRRRLPRESL